MAVEEHRGQRPHVAERETVVVDLAAYCQLMLSRRPLKRVAGRPGCLRDSESNEVFRPHSDLSPWLSERA